ncbi:hypothetical protein K435DRAFT_666382, partial [Dendrothele bispora CBS 962.96]
NIMRDNMIINLTGLPGSGMAIDMNIEHLIGALKLLITPKGIYSDWHTYSDISASIKYLNILKKQVRTSMKAAYQKKNHKTPDLTQIVWEVASTARSYRLLERLDNRVENRTASTFTDLLAKGHQKFESSTLRKHSIRSFESGSMVSHWKLQRMVSQL